MIAIYSEEQRIASERDEVRDALDTARMAQKAWAARPLRERARLIGSIRPLLAAQATELARAAGAVSARPVAEKIVSEVLPLLEACRFLQRNAARVLRPTRHGARGRPLWLQGSTFEVHRKPFGIVLIVGARNYPLFLPAVQMLHALAAGNAVLIKPAEAASTPICAFIDLLLAHSIIPEELIHVLPESPEAAREAVRRGVDKAIFTGASDHGRDFLAQLAKQNTPSVMELSGADAVFVRANADIDLAARAIDFGLRLNGGDTCMAPHAIIVHTSVADQLTVALKERHVAAGALFVVRSDDEASQVAALDEYGLGAAIFSRDEAAARAFANQLTTGFVTINDMIVPTADPRLPFGGVRGSGFGVTRGAEGLLEMTYAQAVAVRRSRFLPHLDAPQADDGKLFAAAAVALHGRGFRERSQAIAQLLRLSRQRIKATKEMK